MPPFAFFARLASGALFLLVLASPLAARAQGTDAVLTTLAQHPSADRRAAAATGLGAAVLRGDAEAIAALRKALASDPAPAVRRAAIDALARGGRCALLVPALDPAIRDLDAGVRAAAIAVLTNEKCSVEALSKTTAGALAAANAKAADRTRAVSSARLTFADTAQKTIAGTASFNSLNLGGWFLSYAFRDDLDLTVLTAPPVGIGAVAPSLRYTFGSETARAGVVLSAGFAGEYVEAKNAFWFAGGGLVASLGTKDLFFNAGVYGYGFGNIRRCTYSCRNESDGALLVTLGGSARINARLRFHVEGWLPILPGQSKPIEVGLINYGLRIEGERLYGNIGFVFPIFEDMGSLVKYAPLGLPALGFGFTW